MAVQRGDVGFVLGLAGFLLGGVALVLAFRTQTRMDHADEVRRSDGDLLTEQLLPDTTKLKQDLPELNKRVSNLRKEILDEINVLEARLHELDQKGSHKRE